MPPLTICPGCGECKYRLKGQRVCSACAVRQMNEKAHVRSVPWNSVILTSLIITVALVFAAALIAYGMIYSYVDRDCIYLPTREHVIPIAFIRGQWPPCYIVRRAHGETMIVVRSDLEKQ